MIESLSRSVASGRHIVAQISLLSSPADLVAAEQEIALNNPAALLVLSSFTKKKAPAFLNSLFAPRQLSYSSPLDERSLILHLNPRSWKVSPGTYT